MTQERDSFVNVTVTRPDDPTQMLLSGSSSDRSVRISVMSKSGAFRLG